MIKSTLLSTLCVGLIFGGTLTALADSIEINVKTQSEPKAAIGIFFAQDKIVQQTNASFERINEDTVVVKLPYETSNLPSASPFATAFVMTDDNQIVFGDTRLVRASDAPESFLRIPICPADISNQDSEMLPSEQLTYLESLLDVRVKKRELARKYLGDKMSPQLIIRLQKLEKSFGIQYENPLSADRPALELAERLARLKDVIRNYQGAQVKETPKQ